jgi:hypothetical protein
MEWRQSTREEIYRYYQESFPDRIEDLPSFITPDGPKQWALAFRDEYPIIEDEAPDRNFIRRHTREQRSGPPKPAFQTFEDVLRFIQQPAEFDPLREQGSSSALADPQLVSQHPPVPAAVYFAVDSWEHGWPVYLDIDAKDIALDIARNRLPPGSDAETPEETREQGGITGEPPRDYPYRYDDIAAALEYAFELEAVLRDELHAEETLVVYSGQGAHVYLLDDSRDHQYNEHSREVLNVIIEELCDIPIDPVVTADRKRVARLPYSLHSEVSRIVQPIESPSFDFRTEGVPEFIQTRQQHP